MAEPCAHQSRLTRTPDGELVCRCGVVVCERLPDEGPAELPARVSLYHRVELGGSQTDAKRAVGRRVHTHAQVSSEFSNICCKLGMPEFARLRAWSAYHKLRSRTAYTRAKCAMYAVYGACRAADFPVSEERVREAVLSVLCVRRAPTMLGVISELHEDAEALGLDSGGHSPWFYLNLEISSAQGFFSDDGDFDRFRAAVMRLYQSLRGTHRSRARRAVQFALDSMAVIQ